MHRKVDKVIKEIEQGDHVVTDMDEVNVDTGTHALKVFHMSIAGALSQSRTEHGHRKITTNLDTDIAFAHVGSSHEHRGIE